MDNIATRFEMDLKNVVKRASKSSRFQNQIDEFVGHFRDLYQEELNSGKQQHEAEANARKRIGSLYKIAFQIVNTPDRVQKGVRLQLLSCALYLIFILTYVFATTRINIDFVNRLPEIVQWLEMLFVFTGLLGGIGLLMAKRLAWKPIALSALFASIAGGAIINQSVPQFKLSQQQMVAITSRQASLDPKVSPIEDQVKAIMGHRDQSPDGWKADSERLGSLVSSASVEFFKQDGSTTGAYVYPTTIDYPNFDYTNDRAVNYSIKLARTNELAVAKKGWQADAAPAVFFSNEFQVRKDIFMAWQNMAANYATLWMRGYQLGAMLGAVSVGYYLLLIAVGACIGRARVYGFDWIRGARA